MMPGVPSIQTDVPFIPTTAGGQGPIIGVQISVVLEQDAAVTFSIAKGAATLTLGPFGPSGMQTSSPPVDQHLQTGITLPDLVSVTFPPTTPPAGDPQRNVYVFNIVLQTDYNPAMQCITTLAADDIITLSVTSGPNIAGACLVSYAFTSGCTVPVVVVQPPQKIATVVGFPGEPCPTTRPGLDLVLVLDHSGSMAGEATLSVSPPPPPPNTRIDQLQHAVSLLSTVWTNLRASEAAPPTDNVGVVVFDSTGAQWTGLPSPLNLFSTNTAAFALANLQTGANAILPGASTSIGDGLRIGVPSLVPSGDPNRRVVLLMTDGLQNTDPFVQPDPSDPTNKVQLHWQSGAHPDQDIFDRSNSNLNNYQIYTVTVGPASVVDATIGQTLASITGGFYLNIEDDASFLGPFFLELLQNFLHFTSWETYRMTRAQLTSAAPVFTTTIPITGTTTHVVVTLRGSAETPLRVSVTPSGEATATQSSTVDGVAVLRFDVPTSHAYQYGGNWTVVVDFAPIILEVASAPRAASEDVAIDFDLVLLGEDLGLHTELNIVPSDYVPGVPVQFEVNLTELGRPVIGVGSHPDDKLLVEVVKPGIGIGDLLSTSSAATTQPFGSDPGTAAQAKLYKQVTGDPASLNRTSGDVVTLTDSGGGIYRGSYAVQTPGHYNFLFGIEGTAPNVGRFSRQQLKTVYVRAKPSGTATSIQSTTQTVSLGNQLTLTFTPRTQFGNLLGPGWANYFWFTGPGVTPFKGIDNLDGSYTARLLYHTPLPPTVELNFIDFPAVIGDNVPPDQLPIPLGPNTILTPVGDDVPYIGTWLVLGPIFDPRQQPRHEPGAPPRPTAAQIIQDIDNHLNQLNPQTLTADATHGPDHGDFIREYGGTLIRARPYEWRQRYFAGMDWSDIDDVRDDIHEHLVGDYGADEFDAYSYLNFAGKRHALVLFLAYIISPDDRTTRLALRHADSLRVWLNGTEVKKGTELPYIGDHSIANHPETLVGISLRRGTNVLLAAVAVTRAEWGFSARIEDYNGLLITAKRPDEDPIAACTSDYQFVGIAGDWNSWNPKDLSRALFCAGNKIWRGRVRMLDEDYKFVGHIRGHLDWLWVGLEGLTGRPFRNEVPGLYDVIFNEDDPSHPVLILVKPFSKLEH
jgi:hypothetical protein